VAIEQGTAMTDKHILLVAQVVHERVQNHIEQGTAMTDKHILLVAQVVHERVQNQGWVVADCRFDLTDPAAGRRSYRQNHIPGAVFLDLDEDLAGPVAPDTGRHPLPDVEGARHREFQQRSCLRSGQRSHCGESMVDFALAWT
jgi:hypothetical protein